MNKIKIGILGYGNIARGIITNLKNFKDIKLVAIFTRRDPKTLNCNFPTYKVEELSKFKNKIDVLILCGGSAKDLPKQAPKALEMFNTVDSFDTHVNISSYFSKMNKIGKKSKKLSLISTGWDPGLFSILRLMFKSFLPNGQTYTFWGKGVSQGHSDAIRCVDGVLDARQYTIPKEDAIELVRNGECPKLSPRQKHLRECFVVAKENANLKQIENDIKKMPNYFADYDTIVHFISQEELNEKHNKISHGGFVLRTGETSKGNKHNLEFLLKLDSNPEFTSNVMLCFARAVKKMRAEGKTGALTVFDVPFSYITNISQNILLKTLL